MTSTKILIIGLGGVGVISAYTLQQNPNVEVTAVVRSDFDTVRTRGYEIDSVDFGKVSSFRPKYYFKTVKEAVADRGEFDFIVITTKNIPDVQNVEDIYAEAVTPAKTVILLLQNGFGIEKPALERFPQNVILSGVSMISSMNFSGKVKQVGTDDLALGVFHNPNLDSELEDSKMNEFVALYSNDKNNCYIDNDVKYRRWRKLVYNCCFNTVAALTDLDVGRIQAFGGMKGLVLPMMDEIIKVAKSDGVTIEEDVKEAMTTSDDGVWYAPSMLVDVRKGNQIENEVILGSVIKVANENKVDIPYLRTVYELLKLIQWRLKESSGKVVLPEERPIPTIDLTQE